MTETDLLKIMDERDKRYEDRFKAQERAVQVALDAQDRFVRLVGVGIIALELALHFLK